MATYTVYIDQFKKALTAQSIITGVEAAVLADPASDAYVIWTTPGASVQSTGSLAVLTQAATGYNTGQMNGLFLLAQSYQASTDATASYSASLINFKKALTQQGVITTFYQLISAAADSAARQEWESASNVTINGPLAALVTLAAPDGLGYNQGQLIALFQLAQSFAAATAVVTKTLGYMRARIADEISRDDLTNQISYAINDAIEKYQKTRFYFNETGPEGSLFTTVANQAAYTGVDDTDIPYMFDVDDLFVTIGVNNYRVRRIDPTSFRINQMPYLKGQPYQYMFLNQTISLMPTPDQAYSMQIVGHYRLPAPTSDSESGNHWMDDAERLIRNAAKRILYQDIILDAEAAGACASAETEALDDLLAATNSMTRTGFIRPTLF